MKKDEVKNVSNPPKSGKDDEDNTLNPVLPEEGKQPFWMQNISTFFTPRDISCMKDFIKLNDYWDVRNNADDIYDMVSAGKMPKDNTELPIWKEKNLPSYFDTWRKNGFKYDLQGGAPPPNPTWTPTQSNSPTWIQNISTFFSVGDIACMSEHAVYLNDYWWVRNNWRLIYHHVGIVKDMPMNQNERDIWSFRGLSETFLMWVTNLWPYDNDRTVVAPPPPQRPPWMENPLDVCKEEKSPRVRKSVNSILRGSDDYNKLKAAFIGIMNKDPNDPKSYFYLASIHGYFMGDINKPLDPMPEYCKHHDALFYWWHRVYNIAFENALRSIDGCEDVTLPYFDQYAGKYPEWLDEYPFTNYVYPIDVSDMRKKGSRTFRVSKAQFDTYMETRLTSVQSRINFAVTVPKFENFNSAYSLVSKLEKVHDDQHLYLGGVVDRETQGTTDLAAGFESIAINPDTGKTDIGDMFSTENTPFDPLFWMMHSDYDRLNRVWQENYHATTVQGLLATFEDPLFYYQLSNKPLAPWSTTLEEIIDIDKYVIFKKDGVQNSVKKLCAKINLAKSQEYLPSMAFAHVTDIDRKGTNGGFIVEVSDIETVDGKETYNRLGFTYFFQMNDITKCKNCREHKIIHLKVPLTKLPGVDKGVMRPVFVTFRSIREGFKEMDVQYNKAIKIVIEMLQDKKK